jgi:hypothetical protein
MPGIFGCIACAIFKKAVKEQRFYYQIKPVHAFLSWTAFDEATDVAELNLERKTKEIFQDFIMNQEC